MTRFALRISSDGKALLNLGCGARFHPEWNNLDFVSVAPDVGQHDILSGLPYEDGTVDAVYSAHFLEHLSPEQARSILVDSLRVLKRGGLLRIVVPDLEYNVHLYLECLQNARALRTPESREHYEWARLNLFEQLVRDRPGGSLAEFLSRPLLDPQFVRTTIAGTDFDLSPRSTDQLGTQTTNLWRRTKALVRRALVLVTETRLARIYFQDRFRSSGELHKWMYDSLSLTEILEGVGFVDVRSMQADESAIASFARYFLDVDSSKSVHKPNSLFIEGRKR